MCGEERKAVGVSNAYFPPSTDRTGLLDAEGSTFISAYSKRKKIPTRNFVIKTPNA